MESEVKILETVSVRVYDVRAVNVIQWSGSQLLDSKSEDINSCLLSHGQEAINYLCCLYFEEEILYQLCL